MEYTSTGKSRPEGVNSSEFPSNQLRALEITRGLRSRSNAGSALLVSIGMVMLFVGAGVLMFTVGDTHESISKRSNLQTRASINAQSGIELAKKRLIDVLRKNRYLMGSRAMYGRPPLDPHKSVHLQPTVPLEKAYWVSFSSPGKKNKTDQNRNKSVPIRRYGKNRVEDTLSSNSEDGEKKKRERKEMRNRFGYSKMFPVPQLYRRDYVSLKVRGTQGMIYINGPDEHPFDEKLQPLARSKKKMLKQLAIRLNKKHEEDESWVEIPANIGDLISRSRLKLERDIKSITELENVFQYRLSRSPDIIRQMKPFITAHAWVDSSTVNPSSIVHRETAESFWEGSSATLALPTVGLDIGVRWGMPSEFPGNPRMKRAGRASRKQFLQPRAPVNVNSAPEIVMEVVFSGIRATFTKRNRNGAIGANMDSEFRTEVPGIGPNHTESTVRVKDQLAKKLADRMNKSRKILLNRNGKGFTRYQQLNNFIFALDDKNELKKLGYDVPSIRDWGVSTDQERLALQQAIVANINPNSRIDSFNPNFSMGVRYGDVSKPDLGGPVLQSVGGESVGWTTEFCFTSNYARITSLARVIGVRKRRRKRTSRAFRNAKTRKELPRRLLVEKKHEVVLKYRETYRLSTQKEFVENSVSNMSREKLARSLYPQNLRDLDFNRAAVFDGYMMLPTQKKKNVLARNNKKMRMKIKQYKNARRKQAEKKRKVQNKLTELNKQKNSIQNEIRELRSKLMDRDPTNDKGVKEELSKKEEELSDVDEKISKLDDHRKDLTRKVNELDNRIAAKRDKIRRNKRQMKSMAERQFLKYDKNLSPNPKEKGSDSAFVSDVFRWLNVGRGYWTDLRQGFKKASNEIKPMKEDLSPKKTAEWLSGVSKSYMEEKISGIGEGVPDPSNIGNGHFATSNVSLLNPDHQSDLYADGYFSFESDPEKLIHQRSGFLMDFLLPNLDMSNTISGGSEGPPIGQMVIGGLATGIAAGLLMGGVMGIVSGIIGGLLTGMFSSCDCAPDEGKVRNRVLDKYQGEKAYSAIGTWYKPTWFGTEFPSGENRGKMKSGSRVLFDIGGKLKDEKSKMEKNVRSGGRLGIERQEVDLHIVKRRLYKWPRLQLGMYWNRDKNQPLRALATHAIKWHGMDMDIEMEATNSFSSLFNSLGIGMGIGLVLGGPIGMIVGFVGGLVVEIVDNFERIKQVWKLFKKMDQIEGVKSGLLMGFVSIVIASAETKYELTIKERTKRVIENIKKILRFFDLSKQEEDLLNAMDELEEGGTLMNLIKFLNSSSLNLSNPRAMMESIQKLWKERLTSMEKEVMTLVGDNLVKARKILKDLLNENRDKLSEAGNLVTEMRDIGAENLTEARNVLDTMIDQEKKQLSDAGAIVSSTVNSSVGDIAEAKALVSDLGSMGEEKLSDAETAISALKERKGTLSTGKKEAIQQMFESGEVRKTDLTKAHDVMDSVEAKGKKGLDELKDVTESMKEIGEKGVDRLENILDTLEDHGEEKLSRFIDIAEQLAEEGENAFSEMGDFLEDFVKEGKDTKAWKLVQKLKNLGNFLYGKDVKNSDKGIPVEQPEQKEQYDPYFVGVSNQAVRNPRNWYYPGRWHYFTVQFRQEIVDYYVDFWQSCDESGGCDWGVDESGFVTEQKFRLAVDGKPVTDWTRTALNKKIWNMGSQGKGSINVRSGHSKAGLVGLEPNNGTDSNKFITLDLSGNLKVKFKEPEGHPYCADGTIGGIELMNKGAEEIDTPDRYGRQLVYKGEVGPDNRNSSRTGQIQHKGFLTSINWTGVEPERSTMKSNISVELPQRDVKLNRGRLLEDPEPVEPGERINFEVNLQAKGDWIVDSPVLDDISFHVARENPNIEYYTILK